jgi:hypothetical protein
MDDLLKISRDLSASIPGPRWPVRKSATTEPVHVVYGGADRFDSRISTKFGRLALGILDSVATTEEEFLQVFSRQEEPGLTVSKGAFDWVKQKLSTEPIEDFRIDFEDGYGFRSDAEEDATCKAVANSLSHGMEAGTLPPAIGIRIKSFQRETYDRATRTLILCLTSILDKTRGGLPNNFVVTLPKVRQAEEVKILDQLLSEIEQRYGLNYNSIGIELMAETSEALLSIDSLVRVAFDRVTSVHFGAYDFNSELGISKSEKDVCPYADDIATFGLLVKLAGSGVRLSDSITKTMPIPLHKGNALTVEQLQENLLVLQNALRGHFEKIAHSMKKGYLQSWDLHPGQLVSRFTAVFSFFRQSESVFGERIKAFLEKATQATLTGNTFDDAATAQGYMNFFRRGHSCGVFSEEDIERLTGLSVSDLIGKSFLELSENK